MAPLRSSDDRFMNWLLDSGEDIEHILEILSTPCFIILMCCVLLANLIILADKLLRFLLFPYLAILRIFSCSIFLIIFISLLLEFLINADVAPSPTFMRRHERPGPLRLYNRSLRQKLPFIVVVFGVILYANILWDLTAQLL